jgi:type III secretory pathway component EscV
MSNLYEKQALDNYLNNGITHGNKISYGSLGRNRNRNEIHQQQATSERQPIIMNSTTNRNKNGNKNDNNSKITVVEFLYKKKMYNTKQKLRLLQKLTKEENNIWKKLGITISDIDIYLAENNASNDCQVDKFETHEQKIQPT